MPWTDVDAYDAARPFYPEEKQPMSDTPRTDVQEWREGKVWCVTANFARTLERELAEAKRALSETVAERDALENALVHMNDPGRWDPRNCEECAAVQRLLDGIYAKRVQEATK